MVAATERLVFALNGERYEISDADPSMSLLEFIRTRTRFRGPKLGCGEGGCGACVVLLSKYDPATDEVIDLSASSCLTLLGSINHSSVTTTEGLGNIKDGYHAIHQRIAGFHASQCGFCTPGMSMSLFSSLVNADKDASRPDPPNGFSKITVSEAEKAISGNLCRCTGYRPLVDACKSFAADIDLEDLGLNTFWKKGNKVECARSLPNYSIGGVCTFPDFLKAEIKSTLSTSNSQESEIIEYGWHRPKSIEHLHALFSSDLFSANNVKLVVGNTSSGVYKDQDLHEKFIDLRGIPELSIIKRGNDGVELGSAVTISKAIEVLREDKVSTLVFNKISNHMNKVASPFVRNIASVGGNLILAQRKQFESDIATILLAASSNVSIQQGSEKVTLTLEEFLERPPCDYRTLLLSIFIPSWASSNTIRFETYRASPRPLGNAVSYVNSAFLAQTIIDEKTGDVVVDNIQLAFGAYGTQHAIRAKKVEDFLKGKIVTASVLLEAIRLLREVIVPTNSTAHPEYRVSLVVGFLFKFLYPIANSFFDPEKLIPVEYQNGESHMESKNDDDISISSRQELLVNSEFSPVGEPIKKAGAELQASGEAVYVDDIPTPKDCLHGAFIYSSKPLAHVKGINFKSSLASTKVVSVVSAKDIPKGGENIGLGWLFGTEPIFADSLAEYAGQPLSLVIAETQRFANMAAKQAVIEYSTDNLGPPILSIEDAIEQNSYFEIPPMFYPKQIGNFSKGMAEADQKIESAEVKLASQYYFYMEPQVVLAVPDEDNCMTVYAATQWPEVTQGQIAKALGIPFHNVRVITRRIGGSFGAKAFRAMPVITACAVAAHKLRRPVKIYLERQTDMIMIGGRHPTKAYYTVGFKSDGKITALHLDLRVNAGISGDCSPAVPDAMIGAMNKYNWGNLSFDIKLCKTNNTSKSVMRAPGNVQGSFIAEAIIEHVASELGLDTNAVRRKNLHDHESLKFFFENSAGDALTYTLPSLFDQLASTPSYETRAEMIKKFNSVNKWKKRGISCVPISYKVNTKQAPGRVSVLNDGSIVVEVGGIEMGQGLWTKVKQMTAFGLKELLEENEDLLEKVRVVQADSLTLIQGGITGGSTTSESSCEAVRIACNMLVERLKPLKDKTKQERGVVSWEALIGLASAQNVNLSASSFWIPEQSTSNYINYGAAISEVEIDVLTGATKILRSDLAYDCGKSLNPAVDLGQVEGGFIHGVGFFLYEEFLTNSDGLAVNDSTWNYKIPTVDTIPKEFNVEFINSPHNTNRVLSSKASGEPPLLLASSVHCALREAIRAARLEFSTFDRLTGSPVTFPMDVPTTMPTVKELCGLDIVEKYLENWV
ncbi:indole-3-acetaldehyde oxidase-like isoform X1 [Carex rostrata]